jgi:hypothetical protein
MAAFYRQLKPRASGNWRWNMMETAMSFEIITFITLTALLFSAGFASGPLIVRKFGPRQRSHYPYH